MSEICFIEAKPRIVATGAETTVRLAGGGTDTPFYQNDSHYLAGVVDMPRFRAALGYDENGWTGGAVATSGGLNFMPADTATVTTLASRYWRDAPITIDAGEEGGALVRRLTGNVADVASNEGQMAFALVDPTVRLSKPIIGTGFAGTGGIEGPAEIAGRAKRRSFGRLFNVELHLLDKVNNIHEAGDPAFPIEAFEEVRDKGRAGPMVVLTWQGSVAATFAALQVAVAPEGGCVAAPSIACVKWWTVPAGPLTADIRGETTGGYVETAVSIAARLLAIVGGPAIADQAAANALRPAPCGIHVESASDTIAQAIDRLFLGSGLFWVCQPDGTIRVGEWKWTAPAAALQAIFIGRERQLPPIKSRKVGYRRNHRVHSASEISAALIPAGDVTYEDGTPIEAWKPAEPGAQSNRPPTDQSPAPPVELPEGTLWLGQDGHQYRFGSRPWIGIDGTPWTGGDGTPWLGTGYTDGRDQLTVDAAALAEAAQQAAVDAAEEAAEAQVQINAIVADGVLDKSEKPDLKLRRETLLAEQPLIQNNAAYYLITTERVAYDGRLADLIAMLDAMVPAYDDYTADTPIDRETFNSVFQVFYEARSAVRKRIAEEAGRATATMVVASTTFIACDYLGVPKSTDPIILANLRKRGSVRVDDVSNWTATIPGVLTGTIDNVSANSDRGDITITAVATGFDTAEILVTSEYDGLPLTDKIVLKCVLDAPPPPPPPAGTGATSAQSSANQTNSGNTYLSTGVVIGPVRCGAAGQIKLEATLSFDRASNGKNDAFGKWGYSTASGGPFTDTPGGEVQSTADAYRGVQFDGGEPVYFAEWGVLRVIETVGSLTPGTDYWFTFRPRKGTTSAGAIGAQNTFSGLKKATQL